MSLGATLRCAGRALRALLRLGAPCAALLWLALPANAAPGLVGLYYNIGSATPALVRVDPTIDFDWNTGAPDASVNVDFAVHWGGVLRVPTTGNYTFQTVNDDGIQIRLNGNLVLNNTTFGTTTSAAVVLTAGVDYSIELDYFDSGGPAHIQFNWKKPGDSSFSVVPASNGTFGLATGLTPMLEYRFEEAAWNGTAGEVTDTANLNWNNTSKSPRNGTAAGLAATKPTTATASPALPGTNGTCGYGVFNRTNKDYVALPSTFPNLGATGSYTATLWMKVDDTSAGQERVFSDDETTYGSGFGPGRGWRLTLGVHGAGSLKFVASQSLPISAWVTVYGISSNVWYFVAFGVDTSARTVTLKVQDTSGNTVASQTGWYSGFDTLGTDSGLTTLGGETNAAGGSENTSTYGFGGSLDEVRVFPWALSASEIDSVRGLTNACPYTSTPTLIGEYRFEEASWSGAAGELKDTAGYAGGPFNGNAQNSPLPTPGIAGAARSSDPGTCGYANLPGPNNGGGNFVVAGLPISGASGTQTSVTFWMYWDGTANTMPLSWNLYNLFISGGWFGFNTDASDLYGTSSSGLANGWHHIGATFTNGAVTPNRIYVDGVLQTLAQRFGTPTIANANATSPLRVGGYAKNTQFRLSGKIDELRVYNGGLRPADVLADYNRGFACTAYAAPAGGFNAFETATAAGSITGVIHTKVAGSTYGFDVVAINAARTAPVSNFYGTVKVELLDASDNNGALNATTGCRTSWSPVAGNAPGTTVFAGGTGRVAATQSDPNAWRNARIRISYPATGAATVVACSTDNFAIRPAAFTSPNVSDADWQTAGTTRTLANMAASGGVVHKAGQPFRLRSTAVSAAATPITTTNYTGTPAAQIVACAGSACIGSLGTLSFNATAAAGVIDSSTVSYGEAGAFTLQLVDTGFAAVDASDGSTDPERTIASPQVTVGRFVPDHFDVTTLVTPALRTFGSAACGARSFTYVGQPFGWATRPQATVLARNAAGATVANYSGALWKLAASSVSQTYAPLASASPGLDSSGALQPTLASNGNGTGVIAASSADVFKVPRSVTVPLAPFNANLSLAWSVADASEAGVSGNGSIATTVPRNYSNMAFDSGNEFRYGVARLGSAYGSELVDLAAVVELQYWDGAQFRTNSADNCTTLAATNVTLGNYRGNLAACQTAQKATTLSISSGRATLRLAGPGNGRAGSVDATLNLGSSATGQTCTAVNAPQATATGASLAWLQGRTATVNSFDQNPSARLSFGQNKSPLVHLREAF